MIQMKEEAELAIYTTGNRLLLAGSALIPAKATRDTAGVNGGHPQEKPENRQSAAWLKDWSLTNPHRFRVRSLPAAGALLRPEDTAEQLSL